MGSRNCKIGQIFWVEFKQEGGAVLWCGALMPGERQSYEAIIFVFCKLKKWLRFCLGVNYTTETDKLRTSHALQYHMFENT